MNFLETRLDPSLVQETKQGDSFAFMDRALSSNELDALAIALS